MGNKGRPHALKYDHDSRSYAFYRELIGSLIRHEMI